MYPMGHKKGLVNGSCCYYVTDLRNDQQYYSKIISYARLLMSDLYQLTYTLKILGTRQILERVMLEN